MNKFLLLACACLAAESALALPDYEPFSDSTGSGGTSYSVGANLIGQVNSSGSNWFQAGPGTGPQPTIAAGDLNIAGLYTTGGGRSMQFGGGPGTSARLNLSVSAGGIQSGTVYFSFALKLSDITGLDSAGQFFAGFNTAQGSQATQPNTIGDRILARSVTGGYNIGIRQGTGGAQGNLAWGSTTFTTSDILFLVGSYTFNTGSTSDDVASLWINPDSTTFGAVSAPGGALTSTGGADIVRIASMTFYDQSAAEPAVGLIDNLRYGLTWADVTPPIPEPSSMALAGLGLAAMLARRAGRKA
jgi:hypothetical protein